LASLDKADAESKKAEELSRPTRERLEVRELTQKLPGQPPGLEAAENRKFAERLAAFWPNG